jgi:hypothetical protein
VRYLPNTEYVDNGRIVRILSGEKLEVRARRRTVDTTYMRVAVPAMGPPPFAVHDVPVMTPNELSRLDREYGRYVVIGGGKTGIDTVLWLLEREVPPERIAWVVPRDAWIFNREICQPGPEFVDISDLHATAFSEAWLDATSVHDLYDRLTASEYVFRISKEVRPTAFRSATVTRAEIEALRRVDDVVRLGRVLEVNRTGLVLEKGARDIAGSAVYINCTANGLARLDPVPVFQPDRITLQSVTQSQQVYGASFIAHIEARSDDDDTTKNKLTTPVPHPYDEIDLVRDSVTHFRSELLWAQDAEVVDWREEARLAGVSTRVGTPLPPAGPERDRALAERREALVELIAKGEALLAQRGSPTAAVGVGV